ncbi:MAG: sulfite exporter TauE/SafE family protein [Bryobacterales bacterium]|nr:sulfite exporter TauE/SafE family protein [Bryobacterales bacterium]
MADPHNILLSGLGLTVVGVSLGLLGAGGSAIAVPVLVYVAGMDAHEAVAVSLVLISVASLFGMTLNARRGLVRWRAAAAFIPAGAAGAWLGSKWSAGLSSRTLLLVFSGLLIVVGAKMLIEKPHDVPGSPRGPITVAAAAFAIGILTGLLGVGGGFLIVPSLIYMARLPVRESIGTSLGVIAANSLVAFAGHMTNREVDLSVLPVFLVFCLAGITAGTYICHRSHPARLKRGFGALLIGLAVFMAVNNW